MREGPAPEARRPALSIPYSDLKESYQLVDTGTSGHRNRTRDAWPGTRLPHPRSGARPRTAGSRRGRGERAPAGARGTGHRGRGRRAGAAGRQAPGGDARGAGPRRRAGAAGARGGSGAGSGTDLPAPDESRAAADARRRGGDREAHRAGRASHHEGDVPEPARRALRRGHRQGGRGRRAHAPRHRDAARHRVDRAASGEPHEAVRHGRRAGRRRAEGARQA